MVFVYSISCCGHEQCHKEQVDKYSMVSCLFLFIMFFQRFDRAWAWESMRILALRFLGVLYCGHALLGILWGCNGTATVWTCLDSAKCPCTTCLAPAYMSAYWCIAVWARQCHVWGILSTSWTFDNGHGLMKCWNVCWSVWFLLWIMVLVSYAKIDIYVEIANKRDLKMSAWTGCCNKPKYGCRSYIGEQNVTVSTRQCLNCPSLTTLRHKTFDV